MTRLKTYDILVIGSGAGALIVEQALAHGFSVAYVDKGPLGGTCLNVGCIPSKIIIFPADRIVEVRTAEKLGVRAEVRDVDFAGIMDRARTHVREAREAIGAAMARVPGLDYYKGTGRFVGDRTLEVNGRTLRADKVFIVSGARPNVPPITGLGTTDYLTNDSLLDLTVCPQSLIIIGGGYIAVEYAHFFAAMGARVTILQRARRLVRDEEPEVSALLEKELAKRLTVVTGAEAIEVSAAGAGVRVTAADVMTGKRTGHVAERLLIAAGRRSNADLLDVAKTGVRTRPDGYIEVDDTLSTGRPGIWAFGDAIGREMFRHAANLEAGIAWHNAVHGGREAVDFNRIPHAIFTFPQIASVGLKEGEARRLYEVAVGRALYSEVARGLAMMEDEAFVKLIVERGSGKILGCHIIGPQASLLIQEVADAMAGPDGLSPILSGIRVHPALSEVLAAAVANLREAD